MNGVSSPRGAARNATRVVAAPDVSEAPPAEDLTPQEEVERAQAAVREQTRTLIFDTLADYERGADHAAFSGTGGALALAGHRTPDRLMRAAMLSIAAGDTRRAQRYLIETRSALQNHIASLGAEPDEPWALSASGSAQRAAYSWMLQQVDGYITDDMTLAIAAGRADLGARYFGEHERLAVAMTERMGEAARAHRDDATHALAVEIARASGDEALFGAVERFDQERIVTLGRVARAMSYNASIFEGAFREGPGSINAQLLADIAGDGLIWRAARLDALYGREAEREHLLVHGEYQDPRKRTREWAQYEYENMAPVAQITRLMHHARTSVEAGASARVGSRVGHSERLIEMIEHLQTLPGRVRCRAVRSAHPWRAAKTLRYQVTYEGTVAGSDDPVEISLWYDVAESRQAKADAQLKRLRAEIPAGLPDVEEGYWEINALGRLAPVIAGPDVPPAPSGSLDELLGPEATCAHPSATWQPEGGVMTSARCDSCKRELLRRPKLRLAAHVPTNRDEVEKERASTLPRLQALACLMGEEPPASIEEILAMPRCDDWRAELRRERDAARHDPTDRRRPRTIAEAMRRR